MLAASPGGWHCGAVAVLGGRAVQRLQRQQAARESRPARALGGERRGSEMERRLELIREAIKRGEAGIKVWHAVSRRRRRRRSHGG